MEREDQLFFHVPGQDTWLYLPDNTWQRTRRRFRRMRRIEPREVLKHATVAAVDSELLVVILEAVGDTVTQWTREPDISTIIANPSFWPLSNISFADNQICQQVGEAIRKGEAMGVSDGSYMPNLDEGVATAAWTIEAMGTETSISGVNQVAGHRKVVNAYWAELQGVYGLQVQGRS